MLYTFTDNKLGQIEIEQYQSIKDKGQLCVGVMKADDIKASYKELGISEYAITKYISNARLFYGNIEVHDEFTYGMINVIDVLSLDEIRRHVGFIFQKNLFILISFSDDDFDTMIRQSAHHIYGQVTMEKVLSSIFERMIAKGNEEIKFTEGIISSMENQVEKKNVDKEINSEIFSLRNRIAMLKEFSMQLMDIGEALEDNDNNLLETDDMKHLKNFTRKAERIKERAFMLDESLIHLREVVDTVLNYKLNNTMNVLTLVTIIVEPIGIVAGWYGMNFINMPELTWKYGYLYVIGLNLAISLGILSFFKRKKIL